MPAAVDEAPAKDAKEATEEGAEVVQRVADPRCAWFEEVVVRNLKVKNEKYKKLMLLPDNS